MEELSDGQQLVIVADDNKLVRESLAILLVLDGYQVLEAGDGQEAINLSRKYAKGLAMLVLDFEMPVLDGVAALAAIREDGFDGKCVIVTGRPDAVPRLDSNSRLLSKPFSAPELREALDLNGGTSE